MRRRLPPHPLRTVTLGIAALCASATMPALDSVRAGEPDAEPAGMEVRALSFNIRYGTARDGANAWSERKQLVFDLIRRQSADVVGLQEALRFQIDEIRGATEGYAEIGVGRDDGKEKGEYSAILYRAARFRVDSSGTFWLSDTPEAVGSTSWGNDICRVCTWARLVEKGTDRAFWVFNTHFDHRSQPSRERSAELIGRRIRERSEPDPFLLMGDLNAGEDNRAVRYLVGALDRASSGDHDVLPAPAMRDTFRALHPDADGVGTFNGFAGRTSGAKIDYIFAPPWVEVKEAAILRDSTDGRYPSDHFPVAARVVLPRVRES